MEERIWKWDFVWVGSSLGWDFLECEYEVDELLVVEELGFFGFGLGVSPFEKRCHRFLDSLGTHS